MKQSCMFFLLLGIPWAGSGCSSSSQTGAWIRVISSDVAITQARLYVYDATATSHEPVAWHDVPEVALPAPRLFDLSAQDPQNQLWVLILAGREVNEKIRITGIGYNNKREVAFGEMGMVVFKPGTILDNADAEGRSLVLELSGCADNDGDGFCPPSDCDDGNADINPEAVERCGDNQDNNCNGSTDEGCPCTPGEQRDCWPNWAPEFDLLCQPKGDQDQYSCPCRRGKQTCHAGTWGQCQELVLPRAENNSADCANLRDDNCDGFQDGNDLGCGGCVPRESKACYTGPEETRNVPPCKEGRKYCLENGSWAEICEDEILPTNETCDGYDNDCDKTIDNNLTDVPDCSHTAGCCQGAKKTCQGASDYRDCTTEEYKQLARKNCFRQELGSQYDYYGTEKCDNLDNDCDGSTDEGNEAIEDCRRKYPLLPRADVTGCSAGQCVITCHSGWGDCNNNIVDGCETPLNTLTDCGACGSVCGCPTCKIPNCSTGTCQCSNVPQGEDPYEQCPVATCKTGLCDGSGACGNLPSGAEGNESGGTACPACQDCGNNGTCVAVSHNNKDVGCDATCKICDGSGNCGNVGLGQDPYEECPPATCKTGHCDGQGACGNLAAGAEGSEGGGSACSVCHDCNGSGACSLVSYARKDNGCDGTCKMCDGSGTCVNVPNNEDPNSDCPAATCKTGHCDGQGACGNLPAGAEGNEGGGSACPVCQDCNGSGGCASVTTNAKDSGCDSTCRVCNGSGSCVNVPAGQDPTNDCAPSGCTNTGYCNGAGACQTPVAGTDPNNFCPTATCKTGNCDGAGACGNLAAGAEGSEGGGSACPVCQDCNGSGSCVNLSNVKDSGCDNYCIFCNNGSCTNVSMGTDPFNDCAPAECVNTGNCNGSGACQTPPNGTECGSRYCDANQLKKRTCQNGACSGSEVVETCHTNETCTTSGCVCGDSGLNCTGANENYCCLNPPAGCYNINNNPDHCGTACLQCGANAHCDNGTCKCNVGFGNCDNNWGNGCEANLNTSTLHCGGCNIQCTNTHGTTQCSNGLCNPICNTNWGDCNSNPNDGCETNLCTTQNCGSCGNNCILPQVCSACTECQGV